jgi:hypothetical protein
MGSWDSGVGADDGAGERRSRRSKEASQSRRVVTAFGSSRRELDLTTVVVGRGRLILLG